IISLGMVERDGVLISLGILLGLATIAMLGALGLGILSLFGAAAV
ncbi:MAG: exopolysaccharide biosynthesis protein, partial [Verrucomicrobia bacterium]|nr:exopolysaccharide biosynthesis protein [Verrucomicrobiota bacterium]